MNSRVLLLFGVGWYIKSLINTFPYRIKSKNLKIKRIHLNKDIGGLGTMFPPTLGGERSVERNTSLWKDLMGTLTAVELEENPNLH